MALSFPIVALLLGAVLLSGVSGCGLSDPQQAAAKGKGGGPPAALVSVKTVEKREIRPQVTVIGSVTPRAISVVASGADGVVTEYHTEQGRFVKEGDVLSVLRMKSTDLGISEAEALMHEKEQKWKEMQKFRPEEVTEAEARMLAAEATRKNTAAKLIRTRELAEQGAVNTDELDDAVERAQAAEELYRAAKANYDRMAAGPRAEQREQARFNYEAQKEHVAWLQAEKEKRTTTAPFDGYVVSEHTFVGMWLSKGDPVVTLAYLDAVDVVVNVDQKDLHIVQIGKQTAVRFPGHELTRIRTVDNRVITGVVRNESPQAIEMITIGDNPDERASRIETISQSEITTREQIPWTGEIVAIVPKSEWESGSRGFPVEVRIKNYFDTIQVPSSVPSQEPETKIVPVLKEGMMAEVTFQGPPREALLVPKDALVRTTRGINIYVFVPAGGEDPSLGRTVQVPVELGASDGTSIQVTPLSNLEESGVSFGPGTKVVTAGGERLQPVQEGVKVAAPPEASAVQKSKQN